MVRQAEVACKEASHRIRKLSQLLHHRDKTNKLAFDGRLDVWYPACMYALNNIQRCHPEPRRSRNELVDCLQLISFGKLIAVRGTNLLADVSGWDIDNPRERGHKGGVVENLQICKEILDLDTGTLVTLPFRQVTLYLPQDVQRNDDRRESYLEYPLSEVHSQTHATVRCTSLRKSQIAKSNFQHHTYAG